MSRIFFMATLCFCCVVPAWAVFDAEREVVDLEALKDAAHEQFCIFMKRSNPHIKSWKKGLLPTDKEVEKLLKHHSELQADYERIVGDYYCEVEADPERQKKYLRKPSDSGRGSSSSQQGRSSKK